MSYLCRKAIQLNSVAYNPGDIIPEDAILGSRVRTLKSSGYIADAGTDGKAAIGNQPVVYTQEELDKKIAEAVGAAIEGFEQEAVELQYAEGMAFDGVVIIPIRKDGDEENGQQMALPMTPEEIVQAAVIMQHKADDAVKAVAELDNENVLIFLHAVDSRSSVKTAAKKQAGKLSPIDDDKKEA